jgi:choline-sulfatase
VAAYYGLCTFVDFLIGRVLEALDETGLTSDTRIIYTSDHGENLGARGMWGKSNMYEESARMPLIISGEGIPEGRVCSTTTSLLDSYQTILQGTGIPLTDEELDLEGASWLDLANQPDDPERIVFSEYHASASPTGAFMIRKGKYKYIHYVDYKSELFDLEEDPEESTNLADNPKFAGILIQYRKFLFDICDPEKTDRAAKDDQNTLIEKFGGREKALHIGTPGATPAPGQAHES